jgi:tRNA threonylcarbamoyl adenosine modification protein YeaZ
MLILAFDTTSEMGGVGIFRDTECLISLPNAGPANRYSISLFEMVERALTETQLELHRIDLYAAANGPGLFTGIRVGLAAARAWGSTFDRPVRGVSVLEAMVDKACQPEHQESGRGLPEPDWFFPILDARRGEFYIGAFRKVVPTGSSSVVPQVEGGSDLRRSQAQGDAASSEDRVPAGQRYASADEGRVLALDSVRAFVDELLTHTASATCVVRTHDQAASGLREHLPNVLNWLQVGGPLVDSIARIALQDELTGRPSPEAEWDAYYIRRTDAEMNWKE